MKGTPIKSKLTSIFVAAAFVIAGALALPFLFTDAAYAAGDDATNYDYDATAAPEELEAMPGVYRVQVNMNSEADPKTIGIPSVAKQNLESNATKEMPAIIMGAAVNYEVRTGPIDFTPIDGATLLPPYSYFRYKHMEKEEKGADGQITKIRTLTGFDGSYYIVRVDVSNIIADAAANAEAAGSNLEGKYLHVRQENNKALLVATGMEDSAFVWADTSKTNNKGGCKAAAYPLANNAEAMLDTSGEDNQKPYLDVILVSSAKNVAGADAGSSGAPVSNVDLSFYVDDTKDYKPWLKALDPNNMPQFPYTIKDDLNKDVTFQTEADYNQALTTKFFDESKAFDKDGKPLEGKSATKYRLMGEDLEIDAAIDSGAEERTGGIKWLDEKMDFWSMEKAIPYEDYNDHTIILICEVPVLNGISISGTSGRSVILDVNSFDIQIANNTEQGKAGLTISNNAQLKIRDGSNTAGAELAIGNNATMVIESGGTMVIDETCTAEAEYDAASQTESTTDQPTLLNGEITVKDGGKLINRGVVNIEGTEGKPQQQGEQIIRDKKSADILVEYGGLFDNYGCLSLKGVLYILGTLNNYGQYNDILRAYDPDKNRIDYHRGIQVTWKDDVTQSGVDPGVLNVGIDADGNIEKRAVLNNYGDIVLVPGTFNLYGTLNNVKNPDESVNYAGHLYLCTVDEAIIPFIDPNDPLVVEKRVAVDPPRESVFNQKNGTVNSDGGVIDSARVALVHNGILGELVPIDQEITMAEQAVAEAQQAATDAQKALESLLQQENPSKEDIQAAYDAVVKAQNALTAAKQRLDLAEKEKAKTKSQISELEDKVADLTNKLAEVSVVDISHYAATLKKTFYEYTGKAIKPAVTVSGLTAADYTVKYSNNKAIGKATVTITGKADRNFKGKIVKTFKITKRTNTLKVKTKKATLKAKKLKKKKQTLKVSKVIKVTKKGQGKLTYAKASGNKKITINKKTGKVTVKKGLKKGTYKVKVKVKAAGNKTYKAVTKVVTIKIKVK